MAEICLNSACKTRAEIVSEIAAWLSLQRYVTTNEDRLGEITFRCPALNVFLNSEETDLRKFSLAKEVMSEIELLLDEALTSSVIYGAISAYFADWIRDKTYVPDNIKLWISQSLTEKISKPKNKRFTNVRKHLVLAWAAEKVSQEYNYPLGRNSETSSEENAYSIVVDAAREAYIATSYNAVRESHIKYRNHLKV